MPTYEYVCNKCHLEFEKVQSMKESALRICPKEVCRQKPWGRGKVQRKISSGAGLIFKGAGFYATDYRSENYKSGAKKESEAQKPAKAESKGESPSAAKPAAASPPAKDSSSSGAGPKKD